MTPAAHIAAAIEILDTIATGHSAEQTLTRWARQHRFAGSKDRAEIRDLVFEALRNRASFAVLGGGLSGRCLMIGALRARGQDPNKAFNGEGYGPEALTDEEREFRPSSMSRDEAWNLPSWIADCFDQELGMDAERSALELSNRAPISLRVNHCRASRDEAVSLLSKEGISARENSRALSALTVIEGARRIRQSTCFKNGIVELQDASSQAAIEYISKFVQTPSHALDYCAGGGGKALALSALGWEVTAHDVDMDRMSDLPIRAKRNGHSITLRATQSLNDTHLYDLVFVDAPCSGSGTWRRAAEAKWSFTPENLREYCQLQAQILSVATQHVAPKGLLVYATCSVFQQENQAQIASFLNNEPSWVLLAQKHWPITREGDGFFAAYLQRK